MGKKWLVLIQILLITAAIAGSVYVAFTPANSLMNWYSVDDAFFYYRVARNILAGQGSTFDGINLSNGYHPLWMVVCLGVFWLAKFNLVLPLRVLVVVSGLFNAATALVLFRMLIKHIHPAAATIGAFFWALIPTIYSTITIHGMESSISAFFLALLVSKAADVFSDAGINKITPRQMAEVGLVGALSILARLDNLFVVAFIGLFLLFKIKKISKLLSYDLILISLAVIASWVSRLGLTNLTFNSYSVYPMLGAAILIKPVIFYFCGLYEGFDQRKRFEKLFRQVIAAILCLGSMYVVLFGLNSLGILKMFSKSVLVLDTLICSALIFCVRLVHWNQKEQTASPTRLFWDWVKKTWKTTLVNGLAFASPIVILLGIYMVVNKIIFGSFTPVSGQIKSWWSTLSNTVYSKPTSILTMLGLDPKGSNSPWSLLTSKIGAVANTLLKFTGNDSVYWYTILFLIVGLIFVLIVVAILNSNQKRPWQILMSLLIPALFTGCIFQISYYNTVGYLGIRSWYWTAQMITIVIMLSILLDPIFVGLDKIQRKPFRSIWVAVIVIALICVRHVDSILSSFPAWTEPGTENRYVAEVREVEKFTQPGARIGMTGGGVVSYFIEDRTIVNLDGLINSKEYFDAMKTGRGQEFLDNIPLDFAYGSSYVLNESDPYRSILKGRLEKIGVIRGFENFVLYRYKIVQ